MAADSGGDWRAPVTVFDWDPGGEVTFEYFRCMVEHPQFPAAARALGITSVETSRGDRVMAHIARDAGRYVAGLLVMWLDLTGGLTLPRLKAACARSRVLSPGRARSFLLYLQHVGYLETVRPAQAAVAALYAPSARFRAAWIDHLRGPVAAAALIAPDAGVLIDRLDDPAVRTTFLTLQGGCLFESTAATALEGPVFDSFYYPLAGVQILSTLIAAGEEGRFPARTPVPLPISQVARELDVSRMHVKRLLLAAQAAGVLTAHPGGAYALAEPADEVLRFIYAAQLICLLIPIGRTLRQHG